MEASTSSSARGEEPILQNLSPNLNRSHNLGAASTSLSPSTMRLWRPAAQRNLRNQWSKLLSSKDKWFSVSLEGRSHATALINAYLSRRYMPEMDLGILKDILGIRQKACEKLLKKQELCQSKLLSSYKNLIDVVSHLAKACSSMRYFLKGSVASPLVQFCNHSEDKNDFGDGFGIPIFSSWPVPYFEKLAQEILEMFALELNFKRFLVVQLLSISCEDSSRGQAKMLSWLHELYPGEFDDLCMTDLHGKESCQPTPRRIKDWQSDNPTVEQIGHLLNREILQVYLTAWLADVNVDMNRVDEIFSMVEEEMQVKLL